jgi:MFS transporter, OFA family, oxalate/formate antiporter
MSTGQSSTRARPGIALVAATIMTLPLGSIYAFSVLVAALEELHQASRSELASVFGISVVFFTIGANVAPPLFRWLRAPLLVALTGALSTAGVAVAAVAPSLGWLVLGYGVLFASGGGWPTSRCNNV